MLHYKGHLYQKLKKPNKDGTQSWRCQRNRDKSLRCSALCYSKNDEVSELDNVFLQIKSIKPSESVSKLDEFISYFTRTRILHKIFTPFTWNHFNIEGPSTNNHVEGFNLKINNYIDKNHPHVYSAINTLKGLETTLSFNYFKEKMEVFVKCREDQGTFKETYIKRASELFRYDKSLSQSKFQLPSQLKENVSNVKIFKFSNQSFAFIKTYMHENRDALIEITKNLRKYAQVIYPVIYK
ncbi:unnamed protein product [Brachionus calyciflorus]|uniref:FLYWCH-type domain-containing protein n=1 Tax=Brachionus calyciflorus TaxID=104777 RepID=A0A813Y0Z2_9BILA|nr:unnamed protein product [Brachionus calyciflorus]